MPNYYLKQFSFSPYWYVCWSEGRKGKRVSTGETAKGKAEQFLAAFAIGHDINASEKLNAAEALDFYYEHRGKDLKTHVNAYYQTRRLIKHFGSTAAHEISPVKVKGYVEARKAEGMAVGTINRELSVLSAALNYAYYEKRIDQPYKIKLLPAAPAAERFLTRTEAALILAYLWYKVRTTKRGHHLLLFTRIMLRTGVRSGAVLGLTWDRVNFKTKRIDFIDPDEAESNKRRVVSSFDHLLERALLQAKARAKTPYVIEFEGEPVKVIRQGWVRAALAAGVEGVTPRTLRHTFATWAMANSQKTGITLFDLAGALAHSNIKTTQRYAKHMPGVHMDVIRAAASKGTRK